MARKTRRPWNSWGVTHGPCLIFDSSLGFPELGLLQYYHSRWHLLQKALQDRVPGSPGRSQRGDKDHGWPPNCFRVAWSSWPSVKENKFKSKLRDSSRKYAELEVTVIIHKWPNKALPLYIAMCYRNYQDHHNNVFCAFWHSRCFQAESTACCRVEYVWAPCQPGLQS